MTPPRLEENRTSPWSWIRLVRIGALTILLLTALDHFVLARAESRLVTRASQGTLRSAHGTGIADACRRMLLESDQATLRGGIVMTGSSVTYGSGLDPEEAMPAQLHHVLQEINIEWPVFNCASAGGSPSTSIPVAAALGKQGARLLMVEILAPSYIEGRRGGRSDFSDDEVALLLGANDVQRQILEREELFPDASARIENWIASSVRRAWRLYRIRGAVWIDDTLMPNLLIWTLRREAAAAGLLPKRFHGQTTNVEKLPWRKAYVDTQRPGDNQRFQAPSDGISDDAFRSLLLTQELAEAIGTPVVFYDTPINLAFQRHFELMSEAEIERLERSRARLLEKMEAEGMALIRAPQLGADGFLDKAHVTPAGAERMARHLLPHVLRAGNESLADARPGNSATNE